MTDSPHALLAELANLGRRHRPRSGAQPNFHDLRSSESRPAGLRPSPRCARELRASLGTPPRVAAGRLGGMGMALVGAARRAAVEGGNTPLRSSGPVRAEHDRLPDQGGRSFPGRHLGQRNRAGPEVRIGAGGQDRKRARTPLVACHPVCPRDARRIGRRAYQGRLAVAPYRVRSRPRHEPRGRHPRRCRGDARRYGAAARAGFRRQRESGQCGARHLAGAATRHSHRHRAPGRPCQARAAPRVGGFSGPGVQRRALPGRGHARIAALHYRHGGNDGRGKDHRGEQRAA